MTFKRGNHGYWWIWQQANGVVVTFSDSFAPGMTTWVVDRLTIPEADCLVLLTSIIVIERNRQG